MVMNENFRRAIENKDIVSIRSFFYTIILSDPGFKTNKFDEALAFVKDKNIEGVIVAHDEEELLPEEKWTEEYFDLLASKLQDNFSEERIEQIKKVAKRLNTAEIPNTGASKREAPTYKEKSERNEENRDRTASVCMPDDKKVLAIAATGAILAIGFVDKVIRRARK